MNPSLHLISVAMVLVLLSIPVALELIRQFSRLMQQAPRASLRFLFALSAHFALAVAFLTVSSRGSRLEQLWWVTELLVLGVIAWRLLIPKTSRAVTA